MIRIRLGQRWKRERPPEPVDSFGVELDGIELLPGANEERLTELLPALASAAAGLWRAEAPDAQVSLTGAHLELLLERQGAEVLLQVVSLERPARIARAAVVELAELASALERSGHALTEALQEVGLPRPRPLARTLGILGRSPKEPPLRPPPDAYSFRKAAAAPGQLGFWLFDDASRGLRFRQGGPALPSLMLTGELELRLSPEAVWRGRGVPFLFALELSRQAEELAAALETGAEAWRFQPGGIGSFVSLDLRRHTATLEHAGPAPLAPKTLLRGMFELGGEVALAFGHRHRAQSRNPYLESLVRRCHAGLSAQRDPPPLTDEPTVTTSRRAIPSRPLPTPGTLKRLRFERAWTQNALEGAAGTLWVGPKGPCVASPTLACGFTPAGTLRFRRHGAHGVAVHPEGTVIAAEEERVLGFEGTRASATWLHDHDGLPLGPWLLPAGEVWLTGSETKGLVAFDRLTGRERWRLMPPRTQRVHAALHDGLVWMATDAGVLAGIDPLEGQARFRVRAPLPFVAKVARAGKRTYALLGRGEQCGVVALDSRSRQVGWTVELPLERAAFLAHAGRVWVMGQCGEETHLCCLTPSGKLVFQKALPLGPSPFHLLGAPKGLLVTGRSGAAVRVDLEGQIVWRLGPAGAPHAPDLPPSLARGLLLLPGETVRLVDLPTGEVLGEIAAEAGLVAARADRKLTVYLLNEDGQLVAQRLVTHLAVVRR